SQAFTRFLDLLSGRKPTGASVVTTIDSRAQRAAAKAIGDRRGAVIAMDYTSGEIVAMYSSPSYDPNLLSSHDHRAELDNWNQLLNDPSEPLKNRSSTEIFPPGSTFKLVTAAAALESGLEANSLLEGPARLQLPGTTHTITNSGPCGDGQISLRDAMVSSCNTAFANLGMTLGADTLRAKARQFGFDTELKTDFTTAASKFPAKPDKPQTAMSAIGLYEVAASPLQMLQVGAAIANDGVLMKPHLGKQVVAADLSVLSSTSPTELGRPINAKTARALQDMMRAVVTQGTGKAANSNVVNIHGKTGTAMQPESRPNYAWMVGFSDEPKIVVVAMIEDSDSDRSDIAGGRLAGPIVRQVIESVR
ncbi:MAG: penicillin-binding protein 2, partial [Propionibacteriaceae bacterium]|nr:penicillin-binding protein 2 [Propionibacteriaceae bacterium]